jgi:pilus assembly protein CpaE
VTGLCTIPTLRQVAETLKAIRELEHVPPQIVVALNRCQSGLLGRIAGQQYVKRILNPETVFYIREHVAAAQESVNTGQPITLRSPSSKISKDVSKLTALISALQTAKPAIGGS